jgi:hypothetical protein
MYLVTSNEDYQNEVEYFETLEEAIKARDESMEHLKTCNIVGVKVKISKEVETQIS